MTFRTTNIEELRRERTPTMPRTDETCPFCGTVPNDGERMCATREEAVLASSSQPLGCPWLSNDDRLRLSNEVRAALRVAQHTPADAPAPQANVPLGNERHSDGLVRPDWHGKADTLGSWFWDARTALWQPSVPEPLDAPQANPAPSLDDVRREARREALEEAAKIADGLRNPDYSFESPEWISGTEDAAKAIRAAAAADPYKSSNQGEEL